jgi:hypothetical protein
MFSRARIASKKEAANSSQWQKDIARLATLSNPQEHGFPLEQLGDATKKLVNRLQKAGEGWEEKLIQSVKQHPRKDLAVLSCAKVLPIGTIRGLIKSELQVNLFDKNAVIYYLNLITALYDTNAQIIHEFENDCAVALVQLCNPVNSTIGANLRVLALRQAADVSRDLVFCNPIQEIPRNICQSLATRLADLRNHNQWIIAKEISSWLPAIRGTSLTLQEQLDALFPDWQAWAAWNPDMNRVRLWQEINDDERRRLKDILSLEGPDMTGKHARLRDTLKPVFIVDVGYILQNEHLRITLDQSNPNADIKSVLNDILRVLDETCLRFPAGLPVLSCICGSTAANRARVGILKSVIATQDTSIVSGVMSLLDADDNGVDIYGVIKLVVTLSDPKFVQLKDVLKEEINEIIAVEMARLGMRLLAQVDRKETPVGIIRKLHTLGLELRKSSWILESLNADLAQRLRAWPTIRYVDALLQLRTDIQRAKTHGTEVLVGNIDTLCMVCLIGRGDLTQTAIKKIEGLVAFWQSEKDSTLQAAALAIAQHATIPADICIDCVEDLCNMPDEFVSRIDKIVKIENDIGCVSYAALLLSRSGKEYGRRCWRDLLYWMTEIRRDTLLDYLLQEKSIDLWFQSVENFRILFNDRLADEYSPRILQANFHDWSGILSTSYRSVLKACEEPLGFGVTMKWILTGWEDDGVIIPFLDVLKAPKQEHQVVLKEVLKQLLPDGSNKLETFETIVLVSRTTEIGCGVCMSIFNAKQVWGKHAALGLYASTIQDTDLGTRDVIALGSFCELIGLQVRGHIDDEERILNFQAASGCLNDQYEAIKNEARRLDNIRLVLKADNAKKTSTLLTKLGVDDPSAIEDKVANVSPELIDVVEKVGQAEFEIAILLGNLKPLQRRALGIGEARILLVRLHIVDDSFEFCMHLLPSSRGSARAHRYHNRREEPNRQSCFGKTTRLTYQLGRELWRYSMGGFESLEATHTYLIEAMQTIGSRCTVCGHDLGISLYRSTTCSAKCSIKFQSACIEVRLADFQADPSVVDLLLTSVHTATLVASANAQLLLPGCPENQNNLRLVDGLPDPTTWSIRNLGLPARHSKTLLTDPLESLLSWLCTNYRGYLTSVTDSFRVPSMPGAHQFVLASATPEKEKAFAEYVPGPNSSRVVFHGTSLDRLYGIIQSGLIVASGGPLQRNGASYGEGIYTAEEPRTAWAYTTPSGPGWRSSRLKNMRLVLGCELDINVPATGVGIYVVSDQSQLMVRYVFLFPSDTALHEIPAAMHVAPAMMITFNSLRASQV